jgi:type IV pilus assembly protein PilA
MKFVMKKNEAGFSLVELMIVVGIIGILASLAMPKMQVFMAKARQSEVKGLLSNIYALEEAYFIEKNTYTTTVTDIGYSKPSKGFYTGDPTIAEVTGIAKDFKATLKNTAALCPGANAAVGKDEWSIDNTRTMSGSAPKCD